MTSGAGSRRSWMWIGRNSVMPSTGSMPRNADPARNRLGVWIRRSPFLGVFATCWNTGIAPQAVLRLYQRHSCNTFAAPEKLTQVRILGPFRTWAAATAPRRFSNDALAQASGDRRQEKDPSDGTADPARDWNRRAGT